MNYSTGYKQHLQFLINICESEGVYKIVDSVLLNPKFQVWSGSGNEGSHHYGDYGLLTHTSEVAAHAYAASRLATRTPIDFQVLLTSVVFHDIGKIWDYEKVDGVWQKSQHCREIHHISRSAFEWQKAAQNLSLGVDFVDKVTHCILSHHGCREFGSPVSPNSREAWILHLSDNMSARINDCGKNTKLR